MSANMYLCTILASVMFRLGYSIELEDPDIPVTPPPGEFPGFPYPGLPFEEQCISGSPLPSCRIRCIKIFKKAYCDKNKTHCKCRSDENDPSYYHALISRQPLPLYKPIVRRAGLFKKLDMDSAMIQTFNEPKISDSDQILNTESEVNDDTAQIKPHSLVIFFIQLQKIFHLNVNDDIDDATTPNSDSVPPLDMTHVTPESAVLTNAKFTLESVGPDGWTAQAYVCLLLVLLLCCLVLAELFIWHRKEYAKKNTDYIFEKEPVLEKS